MAETTNRDHGGPEVSTRLDERTRALKERIYATFTGLAILGALFANGTPLRRKRCCPSRWACSASRPPGFLAEVVAHLVAHQALPSSAEVRIMGRIALAALGSASLPLLVLALSWAGLLSLDLALWIGMGIYAATLVAVMLVAARHTGLTPVQRLVVLGHAHRAGALRRGRAAAGPPALTRLTRQRSASLRWPAGVGLGEVGRAVAGIDHGAQFAELPFAFEGVGVGAFVQHATSSSTRSSAPSRSVAARGRCTGRAGPWTRWTRRSPGPRTTPGRRRRPG